MHKLSSKLQVFHLLLFAPLRRTRMRWTKLPATEATSQETKCVDGVECTWVPFDNFARNLLAAPKLDSAHNAMTRLRRNRSRGDIHCAASAQGRRRRRKCPRGIDARPMHEHADDELRRQFGVRSEGLRGLGDSGRSCARSGWYVALALPTLACELEGTRACGGCHNICSLTALRSVKDLRRALPSATCPPLPALLPSAPCPLVLVYTKSDNEHVF